MFILFYIVVVQYVPLTLFCLFLMVSTVPADLKNILIGTATRRNDQEWTNFKLHEPHGLSSGVCVCVCAVVLTLRLFVYRSLFLCVRILFVYAVHTRGPKQFNTTHITYTV